MTVRRSLVVLPATVLTTAARLPLVDAAAAYAAAGVSVFPCAPGAKRPLTRHGYLDASSDAEQVRVWWRRWPNANIGLPTGRTDGHAAGEAGGFDVLDIDIHPGGSGFLALARARRAGLVGGWACLIRTPSGGLHLYYPASGQQGQVSWALPSAHVDFRGIGGYVIAAPSRVITGRGRPRGYTLIGTGRDPHPLDAGALRQLLAPPPPPPRRSGRAVAGEPSARLGAWLVGQPEGNRNRALFWAACRAVEAGIAEAEARDVLGPAAARTGLDEREITATLASAYRTTARRSTANGPPPTALDRPGP
ncbi:DNA primase [Calidifontibacter sp. DB0510]|uniref:DNA primase n=1 Tax=Metallococcus carri TaxID=1656884 RepID=A0A967AZ98_9MICO|nr:bifunctional DNA primase/polymerase [Metallococcus carri]NHN55844.1 DNA primase [Metallococcus carri]NOP38468.1 DNA primase [Calidifontibacter sp. DB2511S]